MRPRLGMRVRFVRDDNSEVPVGRGGFIDQIHPVDRNQFAVCTDCGGWMMWCSFASWEPTGAPDVEMTDEYKAMREPAP